MRVFGGTGSCGVFGDAPNCLFGAIRRAIGTDLVPWNHRFSVPRNPESANPAHVVSFTTIDHWGRRRCGQFPAPRIVQRIFLADLSSACSTLSTPSCTVPSVCFAVPFRLLSAIGLPPSVVVRSAPGAFEQITLTREGEDAVQEYRSSDISRLSEPGWFRHRTNAFLDWTYASTADDTGAVSPTAIGTRVGRCGCPVCALAHISAQRRYAKRRKVRRAYLALCSLLREHTGLVLGQSATNAAKCDCRGQSGPSRMCDSALRSAGTSREDPNLLLRRP